MSDIIEEQKEYSPEYIKSKLSYYPTNYNSNDVIFTWKFRDGDEFGNLSHGDKIFNGRYAGKEAGSKDSDGYVVINIDGKRIYAHRIAYLFITGNWPEKDIDHINGIRDDNRWENLRVVNCQENSKNQKIRKNNTSGVTGVSWYKNYQKWLVRIHDHNGRSIKLGYFEDFFEAVCRRKSAELDYGYHENHGTVR